MADCGKGRIPGPAYALKSLTGYEGHDITKNRAPAFSLGLKTYGKALYPSPGPYNVGNVDRNGKYPYLGWTIESKASPRGKPFGPSPLSYAPEKMKYYTPAYSLGLKLPPKGIGLGPSPADYFPQYTQTGGFTIGGPYKHTVRIPPPGPKAAVPTDLYKNKAPAYSLGLKGRPLGKGSASPGPKYYPCKTGPMPPAFSFGMKHGKCATPLITYDDNN